MRKVTTIKELNSFHDLSESDFNRLNGYDRLVYLFERFHIGMEVSVRVNNRPEQEGTIFGFYDYNITTDRIGSANVQAYNELPGKDPNNISYKKIPQCNVCVMIDGELHNYYPRWIYPNWMKIRNKKLDQIGIKDKE